MKMYIPIILLLIITSCTENENKLIVVMENGNSIKVGSEVLLKEQKVGKVDKIQFNDKYEVCATIVLNDDLKLPADSKFSLTNMDLFQTVIDIEPGKSKSFLQINDSVHLIIPESMPIEGVFDVITNAIDNSKPVKNQDSIITELHELNEEIKKLNEK